MKLSTRQPLEAPAQGFDADLIFVLAGLEARKIHGLKLHSRKYARSLLLSVGRFEIRKLAKLQIPTPIDLLSIAAPVPPTQRHFFVWFDRRGVHAERISVGRFGTWSEIEALSRSLDKRPEVTSLIIVSSSYHLPRVRICCRALLPEQLRVCFLAPPEETRHRQFAEELHDQRRILGEWIKTPAYLILSWLFGR